MKWHTVKDGDKRIRQKFLFLPLECRNGQTYWLEKIWVLEEFYVKRPLGRTALTGWIIIDGNPDRNLLRDNDIGIPPNVRG